MGEKNYDGLYLRGDETREKAQNVKSVEVQFLNKIVRYDRRKFIFMAFDGENCTIQSPRTEEEMLVPLDKVSYYESDQISDQE